MPWKFGIQCSLSILIFLLFPLSNPQFAIAASYLDGLKSKAIKKELYHHPAWLEILHFRKVPSFYGYRSQADSEAFFLSPEGKTNPKSELLASLEAMFLSKDFGDEHPLCRFPARFAWLTKQLAIDLTQMPCPDCIALKKWKAELCAELVTLVFPTGYMNSPSSMFGHTFLRLEPSDRGKRELLMDPTISFAADTSAQEGVVDYIIRGIFGGFPSKCSIQPYYERLKRYGDIESRDVWEYRLNLTKEEVEQLVYHVWETKEGVFDYYFIGENCAYRLIALLEVARPCLNLTENFSRVTIPTDTIRDLEERGVIESKTYRASAVKRLAHRANYITEAEANLISDIVWGKISVDSNSIQSLSPKSRSAVLGVAYEYLSLLINKDALDRTLSTKLSHEILSERIKSCVPITYGEVETPDLSPDNGHRTHRLSVGGGLMRNDRFVTLGFRDLYHNLLDPLPGFEKGAQIELLDIELRVSERADVTLEKFELINVKSLTPIDRFMKPVSWRFALGNERRSFNNDRSMVSYIETGAGITVLAGDIMVAGMLHTEFNAGSGLEDGYGLGTGIYCNIVYQSEKYSWDVGIKSMGYLAGENNSLTNLWGGFSLPIASNNAVFAKGTYSPESGDNWYEVQMGIHHYF